VTSNRVAPLPHRGGDGVPAPFFAMPWVRSGSVRLHCTDVDNGWPVAGDGVALTREPATADVVVSGRTEDLRLHLRGRR
jgi:hypothetical protein